MTFHVRLVSLPDRTKDLVEALAADVGVSNLLVLPGAAREPTGDHSHELLAVSRVTSRS